MGSFAGWDGSPSEPIIENPLTLDDAIGDGSAEGAWSLAGGLLALSVQLSGHRKVFNDLEEDERRFAQQVELPELETRVDSAAVFERLESFGLGMPYSELAATYRNAEDEHLLRAQMRLLNMVLLERDHDRSEWAMALMFVNLAHADEVVRVAAAAALAPLLVQPGMDVIDTLVRGCRSNSETVRQLAANELARVDAQNPVLTELAVGEDEEEGLGVPAHTSITVHGTWARFRSKWWKPGGDLHSYILGNVSPDLYSGDDHPRWDGRYGEGARDAGAEDILRWVVGKQVAELDVVYAHSHGGNVALEAAARGVRIRLLVLLSVPARSRDSGEWQQIFANLRRAVSLRSRLDLVVLADRSPLRFPDSVRQLPLPGLWFTHSGVLKPKTWDRHQLPGEIAHERSLA